MVRENVQFETALLVSVLLHTALLGGWEHRTAVARLPVVGPLVKVLTPRPKPPPALARTQDAPDPVITFVEEKVPPEQKPPHTAAPESTPPSPQPPRRFIETDSSQVTGEKPKETDLYSDRATVAANPENPTGKIGSTPYLDGTETRMLSTADVVPKLGPPGSPLPPRPPAAPTPTAPASTPAPATALPTPMLKPVELPPRNPETTARLQPSPQTKPVSNPEQPPPS
ncbi:MAG: hypothetical protein N3B01_11985, partial [Verrucomicrobiae bacterium]|nr:hypothetical protein [Verrucomicrobiae bacterium]